MLLCSGQFIPTELMWTDPGHTRFVDGLASLEILTWAAVPLLVEGDGLVVDPRS